MITVNPLSHLARVTAWANYREHPILGSPFSIEAYGHRWAVGASQQFAVAVRRDEPLRTLDAVNEKIVREMLFMPLPESGKAPGSLLAPLKEWCGAVEWPVLESCPECKGAIPDKWACDFCDGDGAVIPVHAPQPGWIGDVLIDRAFLGWALAPFDDERVAIGARGPRAPVHVIGKSWIVSVMPRIDHAGQANAPHLLAIAESAAGLGGTGGGTL